MFELVSLKPGLTHLFSFVSQGCRAGHLHLHQSHLCTIRGAHWRQVHRKPVEDDSGAAAFSCVISCVLLRLRLHRVMNGGSCSFGNHLPLDGRIVPSMSHRDSIFELHHFLLGLCYSSFRFCCPTLKPKLLVTSQFWFCTPVILSIMLLLTKKKKWDCQVISVLTLQLLFLCWNHFTVENNTYLSVTGLWCSSPVHLLSETSVLAPLTLKPSIYPFSYLIQGQM